MCEEKEKTGQTKIKLEEYAQCNTQTWKNVAKAKEVINEVKIETTKDSGKNGDK
mgnify:CR=1 FL=1